MMDTFTVNLFYRQANRKTCKHVYFGLVFIINLRGPLACRGKKNGDVIGRIFMRHI